MRGTASYPLIVHLLTYSHASTRYFTWEIHLSLSLSLSISLSTKHINEHKLVYFTFRISNVVIYLQFNCSVSFLLTARLFYYWDFAVTSGHLFRHLFCLRICFQLRRILILQLWDLCCHLISIVNNHSVMNMSWRFPSCVWWLVAMTTCGCWRLLILR